MNATVSWARGPGESDVGSSSVQRRPVSVRLDGVEKAFGGNRVLRGIDLEIPAGQFVAIVGKSGCGKSTLLRILMGLEERTGGGITFEDASGNAAVANSRIVFQEPRLLPWFNVIDNVAVGLKDQTNAAEARAQAMVALRDVQLADKFDEWPSRLSGGQRQRVALARALVSRPDFLALDEPLGALDALTRLSMQQLLSRVWREQGFTTLLVTHDVSEAVHLADRVIVLEQGRISVDLAVDHVHPRPHGLPELAEVEARLLSAILGSGQV
ncbi:ATP-binding cassette domain-containing protein [Rhizobium sp. KVB221]|uniref:ATP-binding cassette domain-containing protein n=1 Tax=Rhizobium setariae TaxID=2801340 RepID=A0A937CM87_9HYPH|nr:ATP-binding cassette domain-containing protein [Rhizobium setariae]MBL0372486.1 ATP-binding cassette domain-containing protein [Rhizobium setariae]